MSQKTVRKHLLYKSTLSNPDNNVERDRTNKKKINKNVHYSISGSKKVPNDYKELSTKEHKNIMSTSISLQNPAKITKQKEHGNIKNNRNHSSQDLEIMKILTSPEWSRKKFHKSTNSIVNSMVNDDQIPPVQTDVENVLSKTYPYNKAESMEYLDTIQEIIDQETEEIDYIEEKKIILLPADKSFYSVRQFGETEEKELENNIQESINESPEAENRNSIESFEVSSLNSKTVEHEYDLSFETPEYNIEANDSGSRPSYVAPIVEASEKSLKEVVDESYCVSNEDDVYENRTVVEHEYYSYRECCEEQETSPKHKYTVPTTNLPSDEILDDEALMQYFNFDSFSDRYGSEIVEQPSSTGSLNTDVMIRIIRHNKSRNYMTAKQMSNESAFTEAMDLLFEETKASLGKLLVEGLYIVSKRYRQDPFKYLGKWLLIQADIRDENQTAEESMSSF